MLTNETDKLRSDNVKLYEKIKFLQAYPSKVSDNKCNLSTDNRRHINTAKFGSVLSALVITIRLVSL